MWRLALVTAKRLALVIAAILAGAAHPLVLRRGEFEALSLHEVCTLDISTTIWRMGEDVSSPAVQGKGCEDLVLAYRNPAQSSLISAKGGIEAVMRSMVSHPGSEWVQENGCLALCGLACNNLENNRAIAAQGGIEAVLLAMASHACSVKVQTPG